MQTQSLSHLPGWEVPSKQDFTPKVSLKFWKTCVSLCILPSMYNKITFCFPGLYDFSYFLIRSNNFSKLVVWLVLTLERMFSKIVTYIFLYLLLFSKYCWNYLMYQKSPTISKNRTCRSPNSTPRLNFAQTTFHSPASTGQYFHHFNSVLKQKYSTSAFYDVVHLEVWACVKYIYAVNLILNNPRLPLEAFISPLSPFWNCSNFFNKMKNQGCSCG